MTNTTPTPGALEEFKADMRAAYPDSSEETIADSWNAGFGRLWRTVMARRAAQPSAEKAAEGELPPLPTKMGTIYPGNYWTGLPIANPPGAPLADFITMGRALEWGRTIAASRRVAGGEVPTITDSMSLAAEEAVRAATGKEIGYKTIITIWETLYRLAATPAPESAAQAEKCKLRLCCRADSHTPGCTTYDPARYPDEQEAQAVDAIPTPRWSKEAKMMESWVGAAQAGQVAKAEAAQRERMASRFANRQRTAATADFDLPAPNDVIATPATERAAAPADSPCAVFEGYVDGMPRIAWTGEGLPAGTLLYARAPAVDREAQEGQP